MPSFSRWRSIQTFFVLVVIFNSIADEIEEKHLKEFYPVKLIVFTGVKDNFSLSLESVFPSINC